VNVTDAMQARTSTSGFSVPYNFSISLTCGFAVIWHLKG